ncbi:MAG: aldo/keto reductase [Bacteroidota bacterium]
MKNYSKIIAGTMTWGKWGSQLGTEEMVALMEHCLDSGISTFDHADIYGDYTTESDFGKAFAQSSITRESVQFITKCGIQMTSGRPNRVKHYQYDAAYIINSAETSLKNLQTDYLDLLLLHRPSPLIEPSEVAKAITTLQTSGKIKAFGVSNFSPSQIALLEKAIPVSGNQLECSLLHTDPFYDGTFDDTIANERMAMAWSPLGGFFGETSSRTEAIKRVLETFGENYDANTSQLLLAWLMKHPAGIHPVVGTTKKQRLTDSVAAANIDMDLQDWFVLLEASLGHEVA